jgi:3-deoxy-D-manno-octulosonate 8-phosphate phosphatase (KDO 8-P phosphatase)
MNTSLNDKARPVRLAIFDVDGVLTTGNLLYGPSGIEYKEFHVHDGQWMKYLLKSGVEIGIITGCVSPIIAKRMQDLGIKYVHQGKQDKIASYQEFKQQLNLTDEQISYIGDDLPDLPLIRKAGLGMTVANAPAIIKEHAAFITESKGGMGAAREVCELIMRAQGTYEPIVNSFL